MHQCYRFWVRGLECPAHGDTNLRKNGDDEDEEEVPKIPVKDPAPPLLPVPGKEEGKKKKGTRGLEQAEEILADMPPRPMRVPVHMRFTEADVLRLARYMQLIIERRATRGSVRDNTLIPPKSEILSAARELVESGTIDRRQINDVLGAFQNADPSGESALAENIAQVLDGFTPSKKAREKTRPRGPALPPIPPVIAPGRPARPGGGGGTVPAFFDLDAGHSVLPGQASGVAGESLRPARLKGKKRASVREAAPKVTKALRKAGSKVSFTDRQGRTLTVRISRHSQVFRARNITAADRRTRNA